MQFQADLLGITVERPTVLETTALGAAALAGIAVGYWKSPGQFYALKKIDKVFKPSGKKSEMDTAYLRWKEAVRRSLLWEEK
jgi:glycerol kinase